VANNGNSGCTNTISVLASNSQYINITNATCQLGSISAGSSATAQFVVEVSPNAPEGTIVELEFLATSGGYYATASYFPTVKLIVEDFESGDFQQFPWKSFGQYLWIITNTSPLEGVYCSRSAAIGDNKQSPMSITLNVLTNDSISFYSKVSSEETFDKLQFYIDIQPIDEWSGAIPWQRHSYPVTAGVHTFKWVYSKDMASSGGSDCAWVDFVSFPAFVDYTGTNELNEQNIKVEISPNPASDLLKLETQFGEKTEFVLNVFNSENKQVLPSRQIVTNNSGKTETLIDISSLKAGYYTCMIISGGFNISKPFVKQ
jgi:hypothetical protein